MLLALSLHLVEGAVIYIVPLVVDGALPSLCQAHSVHPKAHCKWENFRQ